MVFIVYTTSVAFDLYTLAIVQIFIIVREGPCIQAYLYIFITVGEDKARRATTAKTGTVRIYVL